MKIYMLLPGLFVSGLLLFSQGYCETPSGVDKTAQTLPQGAPATTSENQETVPSDAEKKAENTQADQAPPAPGEKAAEKPAAEKKPSDKEPILDRRWILKMQNQPIPPAKKTEVAWTSKGQQAKCEALRGQLLEIFKNVKHYSISGDGCNTAGYAGRFLAVKDECERECPAGFLENNGYNETIVRNIDTLLELGTKRCLGDRPVQKKRK